MATATARAPHGEKMIEVKVRFWTNEIAAARGEIIPKNAWSSGVVRMERNEAHGISPKTPRPFHTLMDISAVIERVLAIPRKRFDRRLVTFLIEPELDALFRAPDRSTWTGRRDHTLLTLAAQTGLRASELIGLRLSDVHLGTGAHVSCLGKGRKLRITPITSGMVALLRVWLAERAGQPAEPLFVTRSRTSLSRDAVEHRLAKYVQIATRACPSLGQKTISMHVLRHSAAMRLLLAGIETSVIALWLGHEQVETTHIYLHADMGIKERALAATAPAVATPGRFRPNDKPLAFLEAL